MITTTSNAALWSRFSLSQYIFPGGATGHIISDAHSSFFAAPGIELEPRAQPPLQHREEL